MTVCLETKRLILEAHRLDDFEPLAAMWSDPAVVQHIGGRPSTRQESWMRLLRYRGLWSLLGYGYWAVREKASGRFMGDVGFADFRREIEPPIDGIPEAGWVLAAWAHGQGFASEAIAAALDWLDQQPGLDRSVCLIDPANLRSIALAERQGFGSAARVNFQGKEALLLTRVR